MSVVGAGIIIFCHPLLSNIPPFTGSHPVTLSVIKTKLDSHSHLLLSVPALCPTSHSGHEIGRRPVMVDGSPRRGPCVDTERKL